MKKVIWINGQQYIRKEVKRHKVEFTKIGGVFCPNCHLILKTKAKFRRMGYIYCYNCHKSYKKVSSSKQDFLIEIDLTDYKGNLYTFKPRGEKHRIFIRKYRRRGEKAIGGRYPLENKDLEKLEETKAYICTFCGVTFFTANPNLHLFNKFFDTYYCTKTCKERNCPRL